MSNKSASDLLDDLDFQAGRVPTSDGPKLTPKDLLPYISSHSSPTALKAQLDRLKTDIEKTDIEKTGKGTNSKINPTNPILQKDVNSKPSQKLPNPHLPKTKKEPEDDRYL